MGKILNIFLSSVNMFFGAQKAGSFEHAQLMFWLRNRKIKKKVGTHTYLVLTYLMIFIAKYYTALRLGHKFSQH